MGPIRGVIDVDRLSARHASHIQEAGIGGVLVQAVERMRARSSSDPPSIIPRPDPENGPTPKAE